MRGSQQQQQQQRLRHRSIGIESAAAALEISNRSFMAPLLLLLL